MRFRNIKKSSVLSILVFLLVFPITTFGLLSKTALAVSFDPAFGVSVTDTTAGANSNVTGTITQVSGDDLLRGVTFRVPAGWDIADGTSFDQNELIGGGTFSEFNLNINGVFSGDLVFRNDLTIRQGDKAHWLLDFADPVSHFVYLTLDAYVTGDISSGHTIEIIRTVDRPQLTTPAQFDFTFFGKTAFNKTVFTNPIIAGDYTWTADMTSETGLIASRSQTLSMPGSITPTGSGVNVPLGNNISVTFDSVTTAGQTSIATSPPIAPPPEGTGQFQLSGGLYYDFNTTAVTACPCTVTLPYNPVATPDPKIYHLESGIWVDSTISFDSTAHTVTGTVSSFSFFAPGQPDFGLTFLDPVEALLKVSNPMSLQNNRTLPVNFTLADSSGNFVSRTDVTVQVVDNSNNTLVTTIPVSLKNDHYMANLDLKSLGLTVGSTYKMRVVVGNTVNAPTPLFIPK